MGHPIALSSSPAHIDACGGAVFVTSSHGHFPGRRTWTVSSSWQAVQTEFSHCPATPATVSPMRGTVCAHTFRMQAHAAVPSRRPRPTLIYSLYILCKREADRLALTARPSSSFNGCCVRRELHLAITSTVITMLKPHLRCAPIDTYKLGKKVSSFYFLGQPLSCLAPEIFYRYGNIVLSS